MKKINVMVYMALLISLEVIFTRFLAIETPIVRIGFGFIPISVAAVMFGPVLAGTAGTMSDLLGMMIFPKGAYFPGFTVSAFAGAAIYGCFLYKKEVSLKRVIMAVGTIEIFIDLIMNTYWLTIITGKAAQALIGIRFIKCAIMFPVHVILIYFVWKLVTKLEFIPSFNKI